MLSPRDSLRLTADDLECRPRWITPRNLDRPTLGPALARIAEALRKPFMPWQHVVANTAMEVDPDTGLLVYGVCGLTLPRQQGKTCLTIPLMTHRCLAWTGQLVSYAAQTRDAAKLKLREDHEPLIRDAFGDRYEPIWTVGTERLKFDNGSTWGITATTPKSGHGPTLDLGVADEGWAQKDNRLDQAWLPAMMTRANSQMWIPSTMGTDESEWFNGKVDAGRAAVDAGLQQDMFYAEWSLTEDDDPADPANWWKCMPALGHTVTPGKIRQAFATMDLAEFARAYGNVRKGVKAAAALVDMVQWESLADPRSRPGSPVAMGIAVAPMGAWSSIGVVGLRQDGRMHIEVIDRRSGTDWVPDRAVEVAGRWHPMGFGVDFGGPAGVLKRALTDRLGEPWSAALQKADRTAAARRLLTVPTIPEWAQASGEMREAIKDGKVRHLGNGMQPQLQRAVAGVRQRPLGDAWAWGRKGDAEIDPLESLTLARWVYHLRKPFYDLDQYDVALSVY